MGVTELQAFAVAYFLSSMVIIWKEFDDEEKSHVESFISRYTLGLLFLLTLGSKLDIITWLVFSVGVLFFVVKPLINIEDVEKRLFSLTLVVAAPWVVGSNNVSGIVSSWLWAVFMAVSLVILLWRVDTRRFGKYIFTAVLVSVLLVFEIFTVLFYFPMGVFFVGIVMPVIVFVSINKTPEINIEEKVSDYPKPLNKVLLALLLVVILVFIIIYLHSIDWNEYKEPVLVGEYGSQEYTLFWDEKSILTMPPVSPAFKITGYVPLGRQPASFSEVILYTSAGRVVTATVPATTYHGTSEWVLQKYTVTVRLIGSPATPYTVIGVIIDYRDTTVTFTRAGRKYPALWIDWVFLVITLAIVAYMISKEK